MKDAKVLTNDFNLNKVAELQGVEVLNINELANAVKPVVLPGEEMLVHVIKDGKEQGQGVGYLDDGTMIVVDGGRRFIGESVGVMVTSVLQTAAGRMIFAKPKPTWNGHCNDSCDSDCAVKTAAGIGPRSTNDVKVTSEPNINYTAAVIIPAAGHGHRMGQLGQPKQYIPLLGDPIILWTLRACAAAPSVRELVLVVAAADVEYCPRPFTRRVAAWRNR